MKTIMSLLLPAFVASAGAADPIQHLVVIRSLEVEFQQTPQFEVEGLRDKDTKPRYWLELEAELEVKTTDPSEFIPELRTLVVGSVSAGEEGMTEPALDCGPARHGQCGKVPIEIE